MNASYLLVLQFYEKISSTQMHSLKIIEILEEKIKSSSGQSPGL